MLDRIEEIHAEGLAAVQGGRRTEELEELRVRLLGRKAELPNLLRGVGELPPEQRGQVGKRANEVRKALEARLGAAVERLDAAERDARAPRAAGAAPAAPPRPGRRPAAGRPAPARRAPAPHHPDLARARGRLRRP